MKPSLMDDATTGGGEGIRTMKGILLSGILSWVTSLVTPRAVSVVIWTGPRWRLGKPRTRSSEVLSRGGSSPVKRTGNDKLVCQSMLEAQDGYLECPVQVEWTHEQRKSRNQCEARKSVRTPNTNQSNVPLPSSGESGLSAFGSRRQMRSGLLPWAFIRSSTPSVWHWEFADASDVDENSAEREEEEDFERFVKWILAPGPARVCICWRFQSLWLSHNTKSMLPTDHILEPDPGRDSGRNLLIVLHVFDDICKCHD